MTHFPNQFLLQEAVRQALLEDLGRAGDITSLATISATATSHAKFVAREAGIICGLDFAAEAFRQMDGKDIFEAILQDGDKVERGGLIAKISGPSRTLLGAERVARNYMGRLSGIASLTANTLHALPTQRPALPTRARQRRACAPLKNMPCVAAAA